MKASILAILGVATLAYAQGTLPACAQTCALNAIGATGCSPTDAKCICTKPAFLSSASACVQKSCSPADQQAATEYTVSFCASAGVTLSVGASSAPATSAAPASSAPAPASSAPAPASSAPAVSSAPAASSPAVSVSTPAVSQISDGQPQATTGAPATYTGAAMPIQKNLVGGLAGAVLVVAAAL